MVAPRGGGACVVAPGGACMVAPGGACVVAPGGHAWLLWGGMCGCSQGGVCGCSWGASYWNAFLFFENFCQKLHENERIWTQKVACILPWIRRWSINNDEHFIIIDNNQHLNPKISDVFACAYKNIFLITVMYECMRPCHGDVRKNRLTVASLKNTIINLNTLGPI